MLVLKLSGIQNYFFFKHKATILSKADKSLAHNLYGSIYYLSVTIRSPLVLTTATLLV